MVVNLLELIRVKKVMMQTMNLVEYKHLLVNSKLTFKKTKQTIKTTRRQNRKIDRSNHLIKSKCLKWIVKKILPTI